MLPERATDTQTARWRLGHMIESIDHINMFLRDMEKSEFLEDLRSIYAVRAAFLTLGEASSVIPAAIRDQFPEIEWRQIKDFRNFLVHVYDQVDPARLYDTAIHLLPPLREKLEAMDASLARRAI